MPNTFYPSVPFKRLREDVPVPAYAKPGDAGLDLCVTEGVTLYPGEWKMVGSGIATAIPRGFAGLVFPRSGLGCKGLVLKNTVGIIDSGYRGEIGLTLFNNNPRRLFRFLDDPICLHRGDRVAQLLIMPVAAATMIETAMLPDSERGEGGFGSTGTRSEGMRL